VISRAALTGSQPQGITTPEGLFICPPLFSLFRRRVRRQSLVQVKNHAVGVVWNNFAWKLGGTEMDIEKLRQKAYCYDTDNHGLDYPEDDDDEIDDPDWPDDFYQTFGEAV
jgi:hypothetical protein